MPCLSRRGERRGLALPLALGGIVLVGILAASGLYLAGQERRAGENAALAERAFAAAELGLGSVIAEWDGEAAATVSPGAGWRREFLVGGAATTIDATRLGLRTFWVVGDGRASRGAATSRRRLNAVIRLEVPPVPIAGALESGGPVGIASGAAVHGASEATCHAGADPAPAVAGLVVRSPGDARGDLSQVTGAPPVLWTPATPSLFTEGSTGHAWLAERASVVLDDGAIPLATRPAGTADGCDTGVRTNWGEPRAEGPVAGCRAYRRLVHARGDLRLEGEHRGQGILLVDGALAIPGRLEYRGLILVRGRLDVAGELRLDGAALVAGAGSPDGSWLGAGSVVQYERCEIDRALTSAGRPIIARERGWADLF